MDISGIGSVYQEYLANQAENANAVKLQNAVNKDYRAATDDELMDVCKQFEAYFLEQVFKQMEKTIPKNEESSDSTSNLVDYFKDMTIQELSAQATEKESLGIAQMLYEQMKRNYGL
ncbi:MAG: rod-binding protein [Lachnospiraceae bacterium]|nr:rod-binding protein [Lachnospiraceae bacterium]